MAIDGDDPLADRLNLTFNNFIHIFMPEPGMPSQTNIKASVEMNMKAFTAVCQDLIAEFNRAAVEWQLVNPDEYHDNEVKDLETAIDRQTKIKTILDMSNVPSLLQNQNHND